MPTIVKMPQLGESVVEGTVARWLKAPGDTVKKLEPLLEISTDKIDTEVPAPADGVLLEIVVPEGSTVRAGAALAYIGTPDAERGVETRKIAGIMPGPEGSPDGVHARPPAQPGPEGAPPEKPSGRGFVSPVVQRIAAEHDIDLDQVTGTGMGGRISKKDILVYIANQGQKAGAQAAPGPKSQPVEIVPQPAISNLPSLVSHPESPSLSADEWLQPLSAMRRAIAQHMVRSKQTSPHVTTVFEADMTAVVQHRERCKSSYMAKGIKLTFTPYFVAAVAVALQQAPEANSRFTDAGIVLNRRIHIGIAVALAGGLVVPVIRDADEKNLQGLARAVNDLAERARSGTLTPDLTQGGTFTVTNHGVGGSLIGTPILNQPQAGILGVGAIVKRPVVRSGAQKWAPSGPASLLPSADDAIVIRPMCYLSFTFDHRVLDGAQADAFLTVVKENLENWAQETA
jgi:2-oxoglutarate dehydrogenase E2 component (dihydrolipoamide succinyltransferase)